MRHSEWLLIAVALSSVVLMFLLVDPIPQWSSYHDFSDSRTILGIPNALNVLSNLPFLLFGAWGLVYTVKLMVQRGFSVAIFLYSIFFTGVAMVAFGSSYYHLSPSNDTLVWDRVPMTIGFMALLSAIIAELVSHRMAIRLLPAFLLVGLFSVFYWNHTELLGRGDLRLYGLVQFLPFVLIVMMLFSYERPAGFLKYVVLAVACYVVAKLFEEFDVPIHRLLRVVSGHSLKHIFASGTALFLLLMLYERADWIYVRERHNTVSRSTGK